MPSNIPLETTHLYLMGNKFTKVDNTMFQGHKKSKDGDYTSETAPLKQLKVIRLDLNPISFVNEYAFVSAPSLELIYLPFDVKIQRNAFAEVKSDKEAFEQFRRIATNKLEDPHFVAFARL